MGIFKVSEFQHELVYEVSLAITLATTLFLGLVTTSTGDVLKRWGFWVPSCYRASRKFESLTDEISKKVQVVRDVVNETPDYVLLVVVAAIVSPYRLRLLLLLAVIETIWFLAMIQKWLEYTGEVTTHFRSESSTPATMTRKQERFKTENAKCPFQNTLPPALSNCPFARLSTMTQQKPYAKCSNKIMDHHRVGFWDFMWFQHVTTPMLYVNCIYGFLRNLMYRVAFRTGIIGAPTEEEKHESIFKLLIEMPTMITSCMSIDTDEQNHEIAKFYFSNFPVMANKPNGGDCEVTLHACYQPAEVVLDLTARRMISWTINNGKETLCVEDAIVCLCYHMAQGTHPKIHSFANWAFDPNEGEGYLQKMAVVTSLYNHFGYIGAEKFFRGFWSDEVGEAVHEGLRMLLAEPIPCHGFLKNPDLCAKLMEHSPVANFLFRLRPKFMRLHKQFSMSNELPESYNAEAAFVGTLMHGIDHDALCTGYPARLASTLIVSPRYRATSSLMNYVRHMLTEDLPGLTYDVFFKDSPMAFHQAVYREALKIDKSFADKMQTCIIR